MKASDPKIQKLSIASITVDMQIQPRAHGLNQKHVTEIEESYRDCKTVEPPVVWKLTDGNKGFKLSQGFHRVEAARRAGLTHLECVVNAGTELKCLIDAMCSNQAHGLKRDEPDYERVVGELHKIWPDHTDRRIAEASGISQPTVGKYRKKILADVQPQLKTVINCEDAPVVPKREGKDGKMYPATKPKAAPAAEVTAEPDAPAEPVRLPDDEPTPAEQPSTGDEAGEVDDVPVSAEVGDEVPADAEDESDAACRAINVLCYELDQLAGRVQDLKTGRYGFCVHWQSAEQQVRNARETLHGGRPTHECPYCAVAGEVQEKCNCCRGTGHTTKSKHKSGVAAVGVPQ